MNALPTKSLPTAEVVIEGTPVTVRGLSRSEAMHFTTGFTAEAMPDTLVGFRADLAEVYLLVKGTGVTDKEAAEWRSNTDMETVGLIVDKVIELSGLADKKAGKDADPK